VTLKEKIQSDLKEAVGAKDKLRTTVLRLLLAEIKNAEIAQRNTLNDDKILNVVGSEIKKHKESIEAFKNGSRNDLVAKEEAELKYLIGYLPPQVDLTEIKRLAQQTIEEVGAISIKDKGKVMAKLMPQLKGRADGRDISNAVDELLSNTA